MNFTFKFIFILILIIFTIFSIIYFYFSQDISSDLKRNKEITRIYKNSISLGNKSTSALIFNLRDDGKITLSEYNEIVESYKSYSNTASLDQSISKAEQREREFMKRKYQTQENVPSFPLVK